jgi:hypothetical protein
VLRSAGIAARIVREEVPGVARARLRAIRETGSGLILFVDDDNELAPDFIEVGLAIAAREGSLGCFGGRLLLPDYLRPAAWVQPFLPYLAIKDAGDAVIAGIADHWGAWEPPTAGAFVRREVARAYLLHGEEEPRILDLGRHGRGGLGSCEDSLMMRQARELGLLNAYQPDLRLFHHLDPGRFKLGYLLRLMHAYGRSQVLLEVILARRRGGSLEIPDPYHRIGRFFRVLLSAINQARKRSWRWALATGVHQWTTWRTWRRLRGGPSLSRPDGSL